ncbi:L-histidine N(alpha)-methyltransferase [Anaeromyxobacter oryzae]|uniref:Dimethylhistidine N-methyltransferase n=1 Tax=Anaeromyxobacter oryzae TaxID=2918170 RepID=A0ABN6MZ74_9BACT|nr:L-histidine N(alpha)-methyltransferase [Anaeromyxobacter oryzae]BDG06267.1 dimethylhistidine N-methyltransferase [Anaeromyxobacter oryzae]
MIGAGGVELEARGESARFLAEVLDGLGAPRKALSPKWLYDARGSALYELICQQPEYYPTRTELALLDLHADEIAEAVGPDALVFEYGAGSGRKTVRLLAALRRPAAYLPVDISPDALAQTAQALSRRFPRLVVRPVVADFTVGVALPDLDLPCARRLAFFPGSTIGNFDPPEAVSLLRRMAREAGPGGALLVGVDLPKDEGTLLRAYDDAHGVTAAFDLNLLARINRELAGDFMLSRFRHRAAWDARLSRIEMHLESHEAQLVHVAGAPFAFRAGETIHTESSYKWEPRAFDALAAIAGWRLDRTWTDERAWFSVRLYGRAS